ncbi:hypothetical protein BB560_005332 [Smittium megazygosporum]|uniref:Enoyl-CoA hydratase n=1 Tax=Smittium megazygosporum TaxID=133381 RepID=A0A2T9Z6X0_9FUNG|nr:hypothetical protein BB560_005332 [Smittium megazygosporum]
MGENKGFICMNEIDLNLPLTDGPVELIKSRVTNPPALTQILLEGRRFTAKQAVEIGLIDIAVPNSAVFETALGIAHRVSPKAQLGGQVYAVIKQTKNRVAIEALRKGGLSPVKFELSKL